MSEETQAAPAPEIEAAYDPAGDLTRVSGAQYLEVKNRVKWLRDKAPDAKIKTEHIELTKERAVFKASVELPGGAEATGYGSETPGDFRDYIEKAETKALGRALALLGFGTQFVESELEGKRGPRPVDSPVRNGRQARPQTRTVNDRVNGSQNAQDRPQRAENGSRAENTRNAGQERTAPQDAPKEAPAEEWLNDEQIAFIRNLATDKGFTEEKLAAGLVKYYGVDSLGLLTQAQGSELIDKMQEAPAKKA